VNKSGIQTANKVLYTRYKSAASKVFIYKPQDKSFGYLLICFLLWPFGAFLYALYNYTHKESRIILVLFTALYGYSMIAESEGMDLSRYLDTLKNFIDLSVLDFYNEIFATYSGKSDSSSSDLYVNVVAFLVSRFTISGSVLMMVFGLVYGYVYSKGLSILLTFNRLKNQYTIILLICFSFILGLDQLAGVRFGTSAYLFFAGAMKWLQNKDKISWLYILSAVFVHFGLMPGVLLLIIYPFIGKNEKIIYGLTLLSFFIPNLLHNYMLQYSSLFQGGISNKVHTYTKTGLMDEYSASWNQVSWFIKYRYDAIMTYSYFALSFIIYKSKHLTITLFSKRLLLFALLILIFRNFTMSIPELGSRYQFIYLMFVMGYLYHLYSTNKSKTEIKYLAYGAIAASILQIVFVLRIFINYTPVSLFYGNLIMIFANNDTQSLWAFIQSIMN